MDKFALASTIRDQSNDVSLSRMNFVTISAINEQVALGQKINIVALVVRIYPPTQVRTKCGIPQWVQKVILVDPTNCEIELAIWGGEVINRNIPLYSVIAVKDALVRDFQCKKTLSCFWAQFHINPKVPQAEGLTDLATCYLAVSEAENSVIDEQSGVSNSLQCRRDCSLVVDSSAVTETKVKREEGQKNEEMGQQYLGSLTNASIQSSISSKRSNPYSNDNPDLVKRPKSEQPAHTLTPGCSKPTAIVTSVQSSEVISSRVNFETISVIKERIAVGRKIDIIGFVAKLQQPKQIQTKSGILKWVWKVTLMDVQNCEIELAIWDGDAQNHDIPLYSVLSANNATVGEYQLDKTLSCLWTQIQINPNVPEAAGLIDLAPCSSATSETSFETSFTIKERVAVGRKIDVIGLVAKLHPPIQTETKSGTSKWMRKVILTDDRSSEIELTISDGDVKNLDIPLHCVLAAKNAMIREFQGDRKLSCLRPQIQINPNVPQAEELIHLAACHSATKKTENAVISGPSRISNSSECQRDSSLVGNLTAVPKVHVEPAEGKEMAQFVRSLSNTTIQCNNSRFGMMSSTLLKEAKLQPEIKPEVVKEPTIEQSASTTSSLKPISTMSLRLQSLKETFPCPTFETSSTIKERVAVGRKIDFIGLVVKLQPPRQVQTKGGAVWWLWKLTLADDRNCTIEFNIWDRDINGHDIPLHSVLSAINAEVAEFQGGKTLKCLWTQIQINPKVPQAAGLIDFAANYSATSETENAVVPSKSANPYSKENPDVLKSPKIQESAHPSTTSCLKPNATVTSQQSTEVTPSRLNFETISTIKERVAVGRKIDIIGLVVKFQPLEQIQIKSGEVKWIWKVTLTDDRNCTFDLVIWDGDAKDHDIPLHSVLIAKDAMVGEFHGNKTLSCLWTQIQINPKVPQAAGLNEFASHYVAIQETPNSESTTEFMPIREIHSLMSGMHCNVIGFVIKCDEAEQRRVNSGKEKWIRLVTVTDVRGDTIPLTVWCDNVDEYDIPIYSVIIARQATVITFNHDITLSCGWQNLQVNPDTQQALELRRQICEVRKETLDPGIGPSNASSASSDFTPIRRIKSAPAAKPSYNIASFVIDCEPVTKVRREKDNKLSMTQYMLVADAADAANSVIELTVLGMPSIRGIPLHSVITASNAHIRAAGSNTLRCHMENVQVNPSIEEAAELRKLIVQYPSNITIAARHFLDVKSPEDADVSLHGDKSSLVGNFTQIEKIKTAPINSLHDVAGVVVRREPPQDRMRQFAGEKWMRELLIADATDSEIRITVWGPEVIDHDIPIGSVITTNAMVRSMGTEKTLSCYWPRLQILSDIARSPASKELMAYYSAIFEPARKDFFFFSFPPGYRHLSTACATRKDLERRRMCISGPQGKLDFSAISKIKMDGTVGSQYDIVGGRVIAAEFRPQVARANKRLWVAVLTITDDKGCEITVIVEGWDNEITFFPRDTAITVRQVRLQEVKKEGEKKKILIGSFTNLTVYRHVPRSESLENPIADQSAAKTLPDIPNAGPSSSRTEDEEVVVNSALDEYEPEFPYEFDCISELNKYLRIDAERNVIADRPGSAEVELVANSKRDEKESDCHSKCNPISEINTDWGFSTKWNIIGFVREVQAPKFVPSEDSWLTKVKLTDGDDNSVDLLIWYETRPTYRIRFYSVLAAIDAKLECFEGKLQLCVFCDRVAIDPDIAAANRLTEQRTAREEDTFFVPIEAIKSTTEPINTFGLVVEVSPPEECEVPGRGPAGKFIVRKCLLRGRNRAEIELHIKCGSTDQLDIPIQSVIVVERAKLWWNNNHRMLTCTFNYVHLDDIIPEIEGFKEAVLNTSEEPAAQDPNNFTPFEKIKEEIRPGMTINIIGLVVEVFELSRRRRITKMPAVPDCMRVTLRNLHNRLIVLLVRKGAPTSFFSDINVSDVIAARGATLKLSDGDKILWCWRADVTIEPDVPERYTLLKMMKTTSLVTPFTPFTDIERKPWLDGSQIKIIGRVVEVHPVSYRRVGYSNAPFITLVLKNEIEIRVMVDGIGSRTERDIPKNAIVIVSKACVSLPNKEHPLRTFWPYVKINPEIPEIHRHETWYRHFENDLKSDKSDVATKECSETLGVDAQTLHENVASAENEGIVDEEYSMHEQFSPDIFEDC